MTKICGEPMPWPNATSEEIQQQSIDTCAVKSQQIVMKTFGMNIPEDVLALESEIKNGSSDISSDATVVQCI